jgi:hypothetical protein
VSDAMQDDHEIVGPVAVNISMDVERTPPAQQRMVRFLGAILFSVLLTVNSTPASYMHPPVSATSGRPI